MERKVHLDLKHKIEHNCGKHVYIFKLCLGLYFIVCWPTQSTSGDYIPTSLKNLLTMNASKKWNNYLDKLMEKSLNMILHLPLRDAKHVAVKLTKTFSIFAKRDLTHYSPHQSSFSMLVVGRKGDLCLKVIKVPSGTIFHKQYNWNVNYTFLFSKDLHSNFSVCELNFGRNMKNCYFGYIYIRKTFQLYPTAHSQSSFHFCGKHSPFSVYPKFSNISILIVASAYINGTFGMVFETIDSNVLSTLKAKRFLTTDHTLSQHYLSQKRISLKIHLIQVHKASMICLKLYQTNVYIAKLLDGPGTQSPELELQRNVSHITSSFICLLFVSMDGSANELAVFHFTSIPVGQVKSIKLSTGNNVTLPWPLHHHLKVAHTRTIYHTEAMEHSHVNVTVDKFKETQNKQSNFYCSHAGISIYDHSVKQHKEIISYCQETQSSYQPKSNALSNNGSLVLVMYEFALYTTFEAEIHINVSPCGSVRLDPCKFNQFCTGSDLCGRGFRENCENYIHAISKSSNITLEMGQSAYQMKFSIPFGQCVLLQLVPMEETTFDSCLKHGCPLYLSPLYMRKYSGQFLIMTYLITGSFQGKQAHYNIKENHIKLEGPTDYISCTTWSHYKRPRSISRNFTLSRNSYSDVFRSVPCYYLGQNTNSKRFLMFIISQLLTSVGRFGLEFMFRPWISGWVNILLRNTTENQLFSKTNFASIKSEIFVYTRAQNTAVKYTKLFSSSFHAGSHSLRNLPETSNFILHIKQENQLERKLTVNVNVLMTVTESFVSDISAVRYHLKGTTIRFDWEHRLRFVQNYREHSISLPPGSDSLIYLFFAQNTTISIQWFYGQIPHSLPELIEIEQSKNYTGNSEEKLEVVYVLYSYYFESTQAILHFS